MKKTENHKFSLAIKVQEKDIDELGHVNNVVYLRWVQYVATAHWNAAAPDSLKEIYTWVVIRHEIDYYAPAFLGNDLIAYTWVGEHHGAKFDRFVKLCLASNQKILAEAKTTWCLLDAKTRRPRRVEQDVLSIL